MTKFVTMVAEAIAAMTVVADLACGCCVTMTTKEMEVAGLKPK